jgi:hypothetical protein
MRVDLYTKAVLTVIAAALLWIGVAITPVGTPVGAQAAPASNRVLITGWIDDSGMTHLIPPGANGIPVSSHGATTAALAAPAAPPAAAPQRLTGAAGATAGTTQTTVGGQRGGTQQAARIRCQATTQKGSQCSRLAQEGSSFCWQHQGRH